MVFVTPDSPAAVGQKGVKKYGLTRKKAEYVVEFEYPADKVIPIPGGKGAYIKYIPNDVPLAPGVKAVKSGI